MSGVGGPITFLYQLSLLAKQDPVFGSRIDVFEISDRPSRLFNRLGINVVTLPDYKTLLSHSQYQKIIALNLHSLSDYNSETRSADWIKFLQYNSHLPVEVFIQGREHSLMNDKNRDLFLKYGIFTIDNLDKLIWWRPSIRMWWERERMSWLPYGIQQGSMVPFYIPANEPWPKKMPESLVAPGRMAKRRTWACLDLLSHCRALSRVKATEAANNVSAKVYNEDLKRNYNYRVLRRVPPYQPDQAVSFMSDCEIGAYPTSTQIWDAFGQADVNQLFQPEWPIWEMVDAGCIPIADEPSIAMLGRLGIFGVPLPWDKIRDRWILEEKIKIAYEASRSLSIPFTNKARMDRYLKKNQNKFQKLILS